MKKEQTPISDISYTVVANGLSMLVGVLITLIIPKVVGILDYGYFQLYVFYSSYVGFLHFGWADGIFIRYGGDYYEKLDKSKFAGQIRAYLVTQLLLSAIVVLLAKKVSNDSDKVVVFICVGLTILLTNVKVLFMYILQATSRIREYAMMVFLERGIYGILIVICMCFGSDKFVHYIMTCLIGILFSVLYGMYCCKDILFAKAESFRQIKDEAKKNLSAGSKIMIANFSGMLILGIVQQFVETKWDVETFAKVSLIIAIANIAIGFINAVAIVLFPMLRRMENEGRIATYYKIERLITVLFLWVLAMYYPIKELLNIWLPDYRSSLEYLVLLFPICLWEGKYSLLVNTYLKTYRKEKVIMKINIITMVISFIVTSINVNLFYNLEMTLAFIVVFLAVRCIMGELELGKIMGCSVIKNIVTELVFTLVFILIFYFLSGVYSFVVFVTLVIVYTFFAVGYYVNVK